MEDIKKIYCDFDGTITKNDAVNTFFHMYASKEWIKSEKLWIEGKISSRENAKTQVGLLPSLTDKEINNYLELIKIDEHFLEFLEYIRKRNIRLVVLSDGFDLFIEKTFEKYGIKDVEFYANHLVHLKNGKFDIEFPNYYEKCDIKAGTCKCNLIKEREYIYIGDGTSDLCVAKRAKILFAKDALCKHCVKFNIKYYNFNSFRSIINTLDVLRSKNDNIV